MWKLPRKRECGGNESFISTTGVQYPQLGTPVCGQVLLEMQKTREAVASKHVACRGKLLQELKIQRERHSREQVLGLDDL